MTDSQPYFGCLILNNLVYNNYCIWYNFGKHLFGKYEVRMDRFALHSKYKPTGDQPEAIEKLTEGIMPVTRSKHYSALRVPAKPLQWQISLQT